jgi:hypothetical protein
MQKGKRNLLSFAFTDEMQHNYAAEVVAKTL